MLAILITLDEIEKDIEPLLGCEAQIVSPGRPIAFRERTADGDRSFHTLDYIRTIHGPQEPVAARCAQKNRRSQARPAAFE